MPLEVEVSAIHHIERSRLRWQNIENILGLHIGKADVTIR